MVVAAPTARVFNCIIAGNVSDTDPGTSADLCGTQNLSCYYNCVSDVEQINSVNNCLFSAADFFRADGSFKLLLGSPAIDAGAAEFCLESTDLAGAPRVSGGAIDAGCFEYDADALGVSITVSPKFGFADSTQFVYTPLVINVSENAEYFWDFGDGESANSPAAQTHVFSLYGTRRVTLRVVDGDESAEYSLAVDVASRTLFVDPAAAQHSAPYATWETAAENLGAALEAAVDGCEIILRAGAAHKSDELAINKAVTIRGETENPADTDICANGGRLMVISNPEVFITGIALSGRGGYYGNANILITSAGGVISNCLIRNAAPRSMNNAGVGGGVYLDGGLVTHCVISNNSGGIYSANVGGSGAYLAGSSARLENCLLVGNTQMDISTPNPGGTVFISAGSVKNCTIADNDGVICPGIVARGGEVINCIVDRNSAANTGDDANLVCNGSAQYFDHCATSSEVEALADAGWKIGDIAFIDPENCNWQIGNGRGGTRKSIAVDAGINYASAAAADLSGAHARVIHKTIDIGCYEADWLSVSTMLFLR